MIAIYKKVENYIKSLARKTRILFTYFLYKGLAKLNFLSTKYIIICGYPRSGTSLLYNMLSSSVKGFRCLPFEVSCLDAIKKYGNIISKRPLDIFNIDQLADLNLFKKKIIVLVVIRDIRDVVTSIHPNVPNDYFIGYQASYRVGNEYPYKPCLKNPGILAYSEAIKSILASPNVHSIIIKYEDLVKKPDKVKEVIKSKVNLRFKNNFSDFHKRTQKHAYQYKGKVKPVDSTLVRESKEVDKTRRGKWSKLEHKNRIIKQFANPSMRKLLVTYGYETDDKWYEETLNQ